MKIFRQRLAAVHPSAAGRKWLFVPYDQLSDRLGPLAKEPPGELGIVLIENPWKAARRPYHQQKLALVLANQRHFAIAQAERGVAVRYLVTDGPYREALEPVARELGTLRLMEPAEHELRVDLQPLVDSGAIEVLPHEGWLTTPEDFAVLGDPPWRMDAFYRRVRQRTGLLMEGGKPVGGKYSFDADNRKPWRGEPAAPDPPRFPPDEITREVGRLITERFSDHPGRLDLEALPTTRDHAARLWRWAKEECLENFGPYEDAMSTRSTGLFHSRISPLLNLHRLLPRDVVVDVVDLDVPLSSKEGFVRQVLGWREFVRHVHVKTQGFRCLPGENPPVAASPFVREVGAAPSFLGAENDLPPVFWGEPSGLACLDRVVSDVWQEGWSHHITRLMVLSNLATLLDISPRQLTDWFWVAYVDAYDWVVEPNVLAMGTFAVGELMTTKPYVSGAAYINRMSDYCGSCRFDPKKTCPITSLYWAFLDRHRDRFAGNPRLALPLRSLECRGEARREHDRQTFHRVSRGLAEGRELSDSLGS